eukprot:2970880-Rhodomonas_salina.1
MCIRDSSPSLPPSLPPSLAPSLPRAGTAGTSSFLAHQATLFVRFDAAGEPTVRGRESRIQGIGSRVYCGRVWYSSRTRQPSSSASTLLTLDPRPYTLDQISAPRSESPEQIEPRPYLDPSSTASTLPRPQQYCDRV